MAWHTEDYGLTPGQLVKKYGDDEEHYAFPQRNWRIAVEKGLTVHGYWTWVRGQLQEEENELSRDNPF